MAQPDRNTASEDWWEAEPPMQFPVRLTEVDSYLGRELELPGRRIVVGNPAKGWLYDQRAATKIHTSATGPAVGVLPEADWYRAQRDSSFCPVPHTVPVDRIWVEMRMPMGGATPPRPDQSDIVEHGRALAMVPDLFVPPARWPRRATEVSSVVGQRCLIVTEDGVRDGFRALSEPFRTEFIETISFGEGLEDLADPEASTMIRLCEEAHWYRWKDTGSTKFKPYEVESHLVWLE